MNAGGKLYSRPHNNPIFIFYSIGGAPCTPPGSLHSLSLRSARSSDARGLLHPPWLASLALAPFRSLLSRPGPPAPPLARFTRRRSVPLAPLTPGAPCTPPGSLPSLSLRSARSSDARGLLHPPGSLHSLSLRSARSSDAIGSTRRRAFPGSGASSRLSCRRSHGRRRA